jgi:hypothetical protein
MKKLLFFVAVSTAFIFGLHAQNSATRLTPVSMYKNSKSERYDIIKKDGKPIGIFDKVSQQRVTLTGLPADATACKGIAKTELSVVTKKSAKEDVATITLTVVGDPWSDGTGVQLLLDEDAEIADHFWDWFWSNDEQFYIHSEYKIPENASLDFNDPQVIHNGTGSVDIPEGIYDFVFFRPFPFIETNVILYWLGTEEVAMGDDFLFLPGFEYIFTVESAGEIAFETPEDITLSRIILPPPSLNLTDQELVSVVLYNNGIENITGDVELAYKINNGAEIIEIFSIPELASGAEISYTFSAKADFSQVGFYTVEARVDYEFDSNPYNNTITGQTKKMELIELPFADDFDTPSSMLKWSTVDGNGDGYSWMYDNWFITDADGGLGCLQVLCQTYGADEYLLTDPIDMAAGMYAMSFYSFRLGNDELKVLYGTTPNVEEMELLEVVIPNDSDWENNILNFEIGAAGNYFFAFHYYAVYSAGGRGINFDKFRIVSCMGISDLAPTKHQLKLYPNPVNGVLNMELKDMDISKVVVSNRLGQVIHTTSNINGSTFTLNTTAFTSGLYLISVQTEAGVIHSKFLVE